MINCYRTNTIVNYLQNEQDCLQKDGKETNRGNNYVINDDAFIKTFSTSDGFSVLNISFQEV